MFSRRVWMASVVAFGIICYSAGWKEACGAQPDPAATQIAGMFVQTCVRFSGDPDGLRKFLLSKGVPKMNEEGAKYFLKGREPGVAYDATNQSGRLAIVSFDNGSCSAFSESADGDQSVAAIEGFLKSANVEYRSISDHLNAREPALRERSYNASLGERTWLLVLGTSSLAGKIHVMFTAGPQK